MPDARTTLSGIFNAVRNTAYSRANPLKQAVEASGTTLHQRTHKSWLWKGHNTLLTEGTTVLMPGTPENQADFPQQSNQKPGLGFPITRIVGLISLSVGSVISYSMGPYQGKGSGETSLFSRMISTIAKNDLLLSPLTR